MTLDLEMRCSSRAGINPALALVGLATAEPAVAADPALPPQAEAVRKYILETDYPESFKDTRYQIRIENLIVGDVDNDGRNDVTVQFLPHIQGLPESRNREFFEFSRVRQIAVGRPKGRDRNYLAAWVGDEIHVYLIRAFRDDGLLDKSLWVRKAPAGFQGFKPGQGLAYLTESGSEETLDLDTDPD